MFNMKTDHFHFSSQTLQVSQAASSLHIKYVYNILFLHGHCYLLAVWYSHNIDYWYIFVISRFSRVKCTELYYTVRPSPSVYCLPSVHVKFCMKNCGPNSYWQLAGLKLKAIIQNNSPPCLVQHEQFFWSNMFAGTQTGLIGRERVCDISC